MKRTAFSSLLVLAFVSSVLAQGDGPRTRGFIPPLFKLPAAGEMVHFTSMQKPVLPELQYPASLKQNSIEGAVEVEMYVTGEGEVVYAAVTVSSGDMLFDEEALRAALKTRFPKAYATVDGRSSDFKIAMPIYFLLSADPEQYWHSRLELARVEQEYEVLMKEFQSFLTRKTDATSRRMNAAKKDIESKVAAAKHLHRVLAEKKETAILRLRDQITLAKEYLDGDPVASSPVAARQIPAEQMPTVEMPMTQVESMTLTVVSENDIDRLNQELEMKKSYL